jgi:hypothetical protein
MSEEIREEGGSEAATETKSSTTIAENGVAEPAAKEAPTPAELAEKDTFAWPEDWRDRLSGGDDKLKNLLNRYTAPDAFAKAFKELRAAYDSRKPVKDEAAELPENATEEQLAAYRKAKGIPDKPEDYEFEVPEGKELSDSEYEILMDFAKSMHENNMPGDTVKKISSWFLEYEDIVAQKNADRAYQARMDTEEKLRAEWGGDYKANVNLMSNVLQEHLGSSAGDFLSQPLMDGSRLGDNETFIRLMADLSRQVGGSTAELYTTDVHTTGQSLETRKSELLKMMNDPDPIVRM